MYESLELQASDSSFVRFTTNDKLNRLRLLLEKHQIHAYIVPSEDAHQSEYIADCDARRKFITHFSGSAGTAIITLSAAALWTDGRYFVQAARQLDDNWILMKAGVAGTPTRDEWLCSQLTEGQVVGIDPSLITMQAFNSLRDKLDGAKLQLKCIQDNLIDPLWIIRPPRPANPIRALPLQYAGQSAYEKISKVQNIIEEHGCDCMIVSELDEICWLLNARGSDIPFNPVFFAFLIVPSKGKKILLYVQQQDEEGKRKALLDESVIDSCNVGQYKIIVEPYDSFLLQLGILTGNIYKGKVLISPSSLTMSVFNAIGDESRIQTIRPSPICSLKSVKNSVEIGGFTSCHVRDGAAVVKFFAWLENELNVSENEELDEVFVSDKLESFRKEQPLFQGLSFPTISAYASNGAIVHYEPQKQTASVIAKDSLYLCDSGGHYSDGTTDITRTVHFGIPSPHEKFCYTLVLQGHVNLAMIKFPNGTTGHQLDALARQPLWQQCMDYSHGTGHGVGHYLCVHEGPMGISPRISQALVGADKSGISLQPGMIISNEPGYYETGSFGIRIESLVAVCNVSTSTKSCSVSDFNRRNSISHSESLSNDWYCFDTITMVPFARNLIDVAMLSKEQIEWINSYHQSVYDKISPLLADSESYVVEWLKRETSPL